MYIRKRLQDAGICFILVAIFGIVLKLMDAPHVLIALTVASPLLLGVITLAAQHDDERPSAEGTPVDKAGLKTARSILIPVGIALFAISVVLTLILYS